MDGIPSFNSIEEVKSYLNSTEAEHSAVVILDENNKPTTIPFKALVNKMGLDKAAEFILQTSGVGEKYGLSKEEYFSLKEKAMRDPDSLTQEEKRLFVVGHTVFEGTNNAYAETMKDITAIVVKTFMELEQVGDYGSMLAILLTIAKGLLVTSSEKLSGYRENEAIYKEVLQNAEAQIKFPDDMDDELLLLGLFEVIGNRFIKKNGDISKMEAKYKEFAEAIGLNEDIINDPEFIGGEPVVKETERPSFSETPVENSGKVVDVRSRMKGLS